MHRASCKRVQPTHTRNNRFFFSKTYLRLEKLKQQEEKHGGPLLRTSYIIDIFLQDSNITSTISDAYDAVLTTRDAVDTTFQAGIQTRKLVRHKHRVAMLKVLYILYKIIVYKCILLSIVSKNDHALRMLLDYVHMFVDVIIE